MMPMLRMPLLVVPIICAGSGFQSTSAQLVRQDVVRTYADIAKATFADALTTARALLA